MMAQRQDSLVDQLRDLIPLAVREGCLTAADYLKQVVEEDSDPGVNVGCQAVERDMRWYCIRDADHPGAHVNGNGEQWS